MSAIWDVRSWEVSLYSFFFKGALKLYLMYYSGVIIILFDTGKKVKNSSMILVKITCLQKDFEIFKKIYLALKKNVEQSPNGKV